MIISKTPPPPTARGWAACKMDGTIESVESEQTDGVSAAVPDGWMSIESSGGLSWLLPAEESSGEECEECEAENETPEVKAEESGVDATRGEEPAWLTTAADLVDKAATDAGASRNTVQPPTLAAALQAKFEDATALVAACHERASKAAAATRTAGATCAAEYAGAALGGLSRVRWSVSAIPRPGGIVWLYLLLLLLSGALLGLALERRSHVAALTVCANATHIGESGVPYPFSPQSTRVCADWEMAAKAQEAAHLTMHGEWAQKERALKEALAVATRARVAEEEGRRREREVCSARLDREAREVERAEVALGVARRSEAEAEAARRTERESWRWRLAHEQREAVETREEALEQHEKMAEQKERIIRQEAMIRKQSEKIREHKELIVTLKSRLFEQRGGGGGGGGRRGRELDWSSPLLGFLSGSLLGCPGIGKGWFV